MRALDHLQALRHGFVINRIRSVLTLMGIMIGAGSIVALAGLLTGAQSALMTVNQGVNESDTVRIYRDEPPQKQLLRARRELSREDAALLRSAPRLDGIRVTAESRKEAKAHWRGREKRVRLVGGTEYFGEMYRIHVAMGRFIDERDLIEGRRVALVGWEVYEQLLEKDPDPLGRQLQIDDTSWTIVGILAHKPVMGHGDGTWMWDRKVLVPQTAFDATITPEHNIHSIFLRASRRGESVDEKYMRMIGTVSQALLLERHLGVKNFSVEDRNGSQQEKLILGIIQLLILATALMSMFVGGINIMNIMLVTVTERTREIGIRRAMGASPRSIMVQFVLEAGAVALLGGVLGVSAGIAFTALTAFALKQAFASFPFNVELWSVAAALSLAMITGVVFGLMPAWRASRLDPVDALRYE